MTSGRRTETRTPATLTLFSKPRRLRYTAASRSTESPAMKRLFGGRDTPTELFPVARSDQEWRALLSPEQSQRAAQARHRARRNQSAERREASRHLRVRRLRQAPLRVGNQVRKWHGLAQFHPAPRRQRRDHRGPHPLHDPNRGSLRRLRRPSRPCFPRRTAADRITLLHERRGDGISPQSGRSTVSHRIAAAPTINIKIPETPHEVPAAV